MPAQACLQLEKGSLAMVGGDTRCLPILCHLVGGIEAICIVHFLLEYVHHEQTLAISQHIWLLLGRRCPQVGC